MVKNKKYHTQEINNIPCIDHPAADTSVMKINSRISI